MRKLLFILFCFFLSNLEILAQYTKPELGDRPLKEIRGMAQNALRMGDIYTALFFYEEWANRKPEQHNTAFQTAELYRLSRNYAKAEEWYLKTIAIDSEKEVLSYFHLATVQLSLKKYKEAKENFLVFKKRSRDLKDDSYRKLTKNGLASCDFAMGLNESERTAIISHLDPSINKPHIEFSPLQFDEETMVFGSLRESGLNYYDVDLHDSMKIPTRKLYVAKKEGDNWVAKGELTGPFNEAGIDVGNAVLNESGNRIYFTHCRKNWQGKPICQLYYSDKGDNGWKEAVKLNGLVNFPNYTSTQPAVGRESKKNREVLYFVSDRPGGKGGMDVWYTEYDPKKKIFKAPRNAGSKINTPGTENTPYYNLALHRLYFSSDGHPGIGGLDVFMADGEKNKWEGIKNMERDINSTADDIYFNMNDNRKGGFLVSNREGGSALLSPTCCDDIYAFNFEKFIDIEYKGKVLDSLECMKKYVLSVYIKDSSNQEKYLTKRIEMDSCHYTLQLEQGRNYSIEVEKDGYFNAVQDITTSGIFKSTRIEENIELKKIPDQPFVLENILYEFDSDKLTTDAMNTLDTTLYKLMVENDELIILITSHTDSKGSDAYNQNLSDRRAASALKYLIKKGIDKERLKSKGYGESKPIAPNTKPDGSDNPEGRRLNRRTEVEIIGKISRKEESE